MTFVLFGPRPTPPRLFGAICPIIFANNSLSTLLSHFFVLTHHQILVQSPYGDLTLFPMFQANCIPPKLSQMGKIRIQYPFLGAIYEFRAIHLTVPSLCSLISFLNP